MGIFNFFITIPQITNGIIHGWIVRNVYHGHAVFALLTGGVFLFFAAAAVSLVKEKKFSRKVIRLYKVRFPVVKRKNAIPKSNSKLL